MSAGAATKVGLALAAGAGVSAWLANFDQATRAVEWSWAFLQQLLTYGPGPKTMLLAVLVGWLVTLRVSAFPMRCLSKEAASQVAGLAGGVAAISVTWLLWREPIGMIVGAIVGLSTPYTWSLVLILLELCPGAWARRWAADLRGEGRQFDLLGGKR